jgi:conserved repeat domain
MANRTNQSLLSPDRPTRYTRQATKWFRFYSLLVIFVFVASSLPGLIQAAASDLSVSVTDTKMTAVSGEQLTYTVQVSNNSSSAITADIVLILPDQVTFVAESLPSMHSGNQLTWSGFSLSPGGTSFIFVVANVQSGLSVGTALETSLLVTDIADNTTISASDLTYVEAPAVQFDPASVDFGAVNVGSTSAAQAVTLKNNGSAPLTIYSISTAAPFSATNVNCPIAPATLAGNAECTINLTFSPTVAGSANGSLSVVDNAAGSPHTLSLSGVGAQAALSLSTNTLAFGDVPVNGSSSLTFDITNSGNASLEISDISSSAGVFTTTTNCVTTIPAGNNCTVTVTFAPTATGAQNATISITSNAPGSPHTVNVSGTGVQAGISLNPTSLAFGDVPVSGSSNLTFDITNDGDAPLVISGISSSAAVFTTTTNCVTTIGAGNNCTVTVTFAPTAATTYNATITINSNAPGSPHTVNVSGTGIAGELTALPSPLNFGNIEVGSTDSDAITLTNTGSDALTLNTVTLTGSSVYSIASNSCTLPVTLNVNDSCDIIISFAPTGPQAFNATLVATPASGPELNVPITGTGQQAVLEVTPAAVTFADQIINTTSGVQNVTLRNSGNLPFNLTGFAVGSPFDIDNANTTCSTSTGLNADDSCVIALTFTPTSTGPHSSNLGIAHDASAPASPVDVALTGTGIEPKISLSPASLDFGNQELNTTSLGQTVTVANTGSGDLTITGISVPSGFVQSSTCDTTLAEGATCTITVQFKPTTLGNQSGTLTVASNAVSGGNSVDLSGTGVQAAIQLSPTSFDFGNVNVGESATQTLTITNNGTHPLTINTISVSGDFSYNNVDCPLAPASLAENTSCTIELTFQPSSSRAVTQQLTISSNAPNSPHSVPLAGTGIASEYASTPTPNSTITMSSVFNQSNSVVIKVQNTGSANLTVSAPSETIAAPFSVSPNTSFSVAPNASQDIVVTCTPTEAGPYTQTLTYTSNAPNQPTAVYNISCTGTPAPTAGFSSNPAPGSTWHIGNPFAGFNSSGNIVIKETGTADLVVDLAGGSLATAITGPNADEFTITAPGNFPLTISDGGEDGRITVQCTPTAMGLRTATLTLTTNDPSQPTVSYTLTCQWRTSSSYTVYLPIVKQEQGVQPGMPDLIAKLNVSTLTLKAGEPVGISVTVTNQGTAPASEFWVDLYINPSAAPTGPNQPWNELCTLDPCYGIAWYVSQTIQPGQSIILTSEPDSYYADNTIWNGSFAPGTSDLYVYVDSWNPTVATGAVVESDEGNNRDEIHGLKVSGSLTSSNDLRRADKLPERPVRP